MDSIRQSTTHLLQKILDHKIPFDEAFDQKVLPQLTSQQRRTIYHHTTVILRHLGVIDTVIQRYSKIKLNRLDKDVRAVLRFGVGEVLFLDTPSYAAVNSAVALVRAKHLKNFVNAILRSVSRDKANLLKTLDQDQLALPEWLWTRWCRFYGEETTRQMIQAQKQEPLWDISVKQDPTFWAQQLEAKILPNNTLRTQHLWPLDDKPGFKEGEWWIQGAEASMPVHFFSDMVGKIVVDLCAAPGGKTAQLIAKGAKVIAVDKDATRLLRLKDNLKRLHMTVDIIQADARTWAPSDPVDAILLDAPCSATGTIRKNPDLPWLKTEQDIKENAERQRQILTQALTYLKPGGVLIYAVCSLEPEEGPEQINWILDHDKTIERWHLTEQDCFGDSQLITQHGDLQTLPCYWQEWGGLQGFYAARLRKK